MPLEEGVCAKLSTKVLIFYTLSCNYLLMASVATHSEAPVRKGQAGVHSTRHQTREHTAGRHSG